MATLYMVRRDGYPDYFLDTDHDCCDDFREATDADATVEAMATMLDQFAENHNAHDFVGTHKALGELLADVCGEEAAWNVMRRLCDCEGIPGLTGVCGMGE